jgi:N-acyl-D-amino-acid deacylase
MVVSPGFIDTHTHSEGALLTDPQHANGLRQGITTLILGLDGMSYAPLSADNYLIHRHYLGGLLGDPPEDLDMSSVAAFRANYHKKVALNTAYLVPQGTVRLEVAGFRDVPLDDDALEKAKQLVKEGIEQGAVGFSTGGAYYPGPWGDTHEFIELCKTVQEMDSIYVAEPRRANASRAFGGDGVLEALEIARQTGVKLHLSHFRTDFKNPGTIADRLGPVDEAKSQGVDCTLDIYPYPTGSSISVSVLPSYVQDGGPEAIMRRLTDPTERQKLREILHEEFEMSVALDEVVFTYLPKNSHLEGMTLPDVAAHLGTSVEDALCDLLVDENLKIGYRGAPPHNVANWRQHNLDCMNLLARPDYMVCSDITPAGSFTHPRSFGAFPRFLGRFRREYGILNLEQMVHRMTERPAQRFGLTRRGRIEKGYYADVAVFDSERVIDNSTFDDPRQFPTGLPFVVVNGQVAVDHERCTGVLAGQAVP